jgi:alcohol dehydrogenase (NADP+)
MSHPTTAADPLVLVGVPEHPHSSPGIGNPTFRRRTIAGPLVVGVAESREMLDFHAPGITDIEMIRAEAIDDACERMLESDVNCRFVI